MIKKQLYLLIFISIGWCNILYAQSMILQTKISYQAENEHIATILDNITSNHQIEFSYNSKIIKPYFNSTLDAINKPLYQVLSDLLDNYSLNYKDVNGIIVIFESKDDYEERYESPHKNINIFGYVTNEVTGNPISNVNVFISNTTIGTTTDEQGFYQLSVNLKGFQELILSHVSYSLVVRKLDMRSIESNEFSFVMKEIINELNEVVISYSQKKWKKYLKIFEKEFIGETPNASKCKLINPWVLDFNYDPKTDMLKASSQELLVVENKSLGYNISNLLILFEFQNGTVKYLSKSKFEEISSENRVQERKWKKKRKDVFLGSYHHFIKALTEHKLKKNGFDISLINSLTNYSTKTPIKSTDIIRIVNFHHKIKFTNFLEVIYKDPVESSYITFTHRNDPQLRYQNFLNTYKKQNSILEIVGQEESVIIESGLIKTPFSIKKYGYWSWKRMADQLPSNFKLIPD